MNIQQKIQTLAEKYHNETVATRHHLHANPELSFHEYETSKFVQQKLGEMGIPFQNGVAGTGVVGLIKGNNPEKQTVALRADMDALPILEANDVPYKSKNEGVMHACGHDGHTAIALGVAKLFSNNRDKLSGRIKFVFQHDRSCKGLLFFIPHPRPDGLLYLYDVIHV